MNESSIVPARVYVFFTAVVDLILLGLILGVLRPLFAWAGDWYGMADLGPTLTGIFLGLTLFGAILQSIVGVWVYSHPDAARVVIRAINEKQF